MKVSTPARHSRSNDKKKHGIIHSHALAGAVLAASLLTACGDSGPFDGSTAASSAAAEKSRDGRDDPALNIDGMTTDADGNVVAAASSPAQGASQPAAPATVNSVDTIVNDMKLMNDTELVGVPSNYGWAKGPGYVMMGNIPRGTNTPSWWQVNNSYYKSGAWWNAILPWFVIFDGAGNAARNTRVQVRDMKLYMKSKSTGTWNLLSHSVGVGGEYFPKTLQGSNVSTPDTRTESDGSTSILPPLGNLVFHGWGNGFSEIDGSDVAAVFMTLQARLVVDDANGSDDRGAARYLVHVGGDYYPDTSTRVSDLAPAYYFPGIGVSRAKLVSNDWQAFNFSTIDAGVQDPGGGLSEAELRANPPPLD